MPLDQFYTNPDISKQCIDLMNFDNYDIILEPSAGNGSFFNQLPIDKRVGIDLEPKAEGITKLDFFMFSPIKSKKYLVIGNPPFGRVSSVAIDFFNHAATFADTIAFIIPRTFRRVSVQNKLHMGFELIKDIEIPMGSFIPKSMKAKCCFQIWKKTTNVRKKIILPLTHNDFKVLYIDDFESADFAIRAYGSNCGEINFNVRELAPRSWHFIKPDKKTKDFLLDKFKKLKYYPLASDTARQDSIGKAELIMLYNEELNNK